MTETVTRPVATQNMRVCGNGSGAGYKYNRFSKTENRLRQETLIITNTSLNTDARRLVGFMDCALIPLFRLIASSGRLSGLLQLHSADLLSTTHISNTDTHKLSYSGNQTREQSKNTNYCSRHKRDSQREETDNSTFAKPQTTRSNKADKTNIPGNSIDPDTDRQNAYRDSREE